MADDVRNSALGRVRGDPDIASAMVAQPDGPSGPAGWPRDAPSPEAGAARELEPHLLEPIDGKRK